MTMFVVQYQEEDWGPPQLHEDSRIFPTRELAEAYIALLPREHYSEWVITEVIVGG